MEKKKYPIGAENYTLYEEVGQGGNASVHRALCNPFNEDVAIKILDFERRNSDLNNISREAQIMTLVDHPNVLKSHCSFVNDHNLWVVMPFMAGGSCLHILKAVYPDGFEELVIATVLREVLKGLEYLHQHGHIHRDVKAGNILIDGRGAIKLGDFGVSACLFDSGDRQRLRNTFVGTPCWMAPEVMEQLHGYDFRADIWSFGITALELAHGHAPFSKYPPMKVLLMTLQNAPPSLDYPRDRKFSKSFKQMIASCLVKDPSKRPSAKKLLKHSFFKQAKSNDYIARTLLDGLPGLGDRLRELKRKEEDMLAQKKMPDGEKEELSQNEYKRGISGWNFNLDDMKAQASLIQDIDDSASESNGGGSSSSLCALDVTEKQLHRQPSMASHLSQVGETDDNDLMPDQLAPLRPVDSSMNGAKVRCDRSDDESSVASSSNEYQVSRNCPRYDDHINIYSNKNDLETFGRPMEPLTIHSRRKSCTSVSPNLPELTVTSFRGERVQNQSENMASGSTTPRITDDSPREMLVRACKSPAISDDDKAKGQVIQQKGRFKVTSESVNLEKVASSPVLQKSHSFQVGSLDVIPQHSTISIPSPSDIMPSNHLGVSLFPALCSVLQTNIVQRDVILSLMKQVSAHDLTAANRDGGSMQSMEKSLYETLHEREKELLREVTDLQWRLIGMQDELQKLKADNAQV